MYVVSVNKYVPPEFLTWLHGIHRSAAVSTCIHTTYIHLCARPGKIYIDYMHLFLYFFPCSLRPDAPPRPLPCSHDAPAPMAGMDEQRSLLEGRSLMALYLLAHKHGVDTDGCETKAAVIQAILASLQGKSLMALCLLAHEQGVNTDSCETKAAVIHALLGGSAVEKVGGAAASLSSAAVPRAAPAWGMDLSPGGSPAAKEVSQVRNNTCLFIDARQRKAASVSMLGKPPGLVVACGGALSGLDRAWRMCVCRVHSKYVVDSDLSPGAPPMAEFFSPYACERSESARVGVVPQERAH